MKRYYVLVMAALSLSVVGVAHAGGWQPATKVSQYIIEGSSAAERLYVRFESITNPDACSGPGMNRVYGNTAQGKLIFASVLTAKAAAQTVTPLLSGCDDWGRPILAGIWTY